MEYDPDLLTFVRAVAQTFFLRGHGMFIPSDSSKWVKPYAALSHRINVWYIC